MEYKKFFPFYLPIFLAASIPFLCSLSTVIIVIRFVLIMLYSWNMVNPNKRISPIF